MRYVDKFGAVQHNVNLHTAEYTVALFQSSRIVRPVLSVPAEKREMR